MKTFQHFSPYNGPQWEPNGSRSKWEFQCKLFKLINSFLHPSPVLINENRQSLKRITCWSLLGQSNIYWISALIRTVTMASVLRLELLLTTQFRIASFFWVTITQFTFDLSNFADLLHSHSDILHTTWKLISEKPNNASECGHWPSILSHILLLTTICKLSYIKTFFFYKIVLIPPKTYEKSAFRSISIEK